MIVPTSTRFLLDTLISDCVDVITGVDTDWLTTSEAILLMVFADTLIVLPGAVIVGADTEVATKLLTALTLFPDMLISAVGELIVVVTTDPMLLSVLPDILMIAPGADTVLATRDPPTVTFPEVLIVPIFVSPFADMLMLVPGAVTVLVFNVPVIKVDISDTWLNAMLSVPEADVNVCSSAVVPCRNATLEN